MTTFGTIDQAIDDLRHGKIIIVADDEDRENEGDLVAAAELVTPETINFMTLHGRGLICPALTGERCDQLGLPQIADRNTEELSTAFTVSIDAERRRAERALRLELGRQAVDREIGRLRLLAGLAVAGWLGTLLFVPSLLETSIASRAALGVGWVCLLAALGASFTAQSVVARSLGDLQPDASGSVSISAGPAGAVAPWLIVAGLGVIGLGVLIA